jgi:hypothetical protein
VAAPLARNDMKTIAESLRKVSTFGPAGFTTWPTIAQDGAAAADRGDRTALRAACNQCHGTWREAYRQQFRERPLPF